MCSLDASDLRARSLVENLLVELSDDDARLADFDETADGGYCVQVEIPGELGQELRLSKRLVRAALRDRRSFAALRQIVRANLAFTVKHHVSPAGVTRAAQPSPTVITVGVITGVDDEAGIIALGDTVVWVGAGMPFGGLPAGSAVTVAWQVRNGRNEAIAIRVRSLAQPDAAAGTTKGDSR
jgi:hypothetical protein